MRVYRQIQFFWPHWRPAKLVCLVYLANSVTSLVLLQYEAASLRWMDPIQLAEMLFMLWLLIVGAKPRPVEN